MVKVFFGLKWHLVTSRFRSMSGVKKAWSILALVLLLAFTLFAAFGISLSRTTPEVARTLATLLLTSQLVAWALTPLIAFGVDETVDPQRFSLLPLRRRTMISGLTAAAFIGWLPAANVVILIGVAIALSLPIWLLPIALICAAAQMVLCIVLSRATATSLAALMSSRRGRDLGMLAGFGVFVLYLAATAFLNVLSKSADLGNKLVDLGALLGWLPPGALVRIPGLVASGDYAAAGLCVVIAGAAIALALWWWAVALKKNLETVPSTTQSSAPAGDHQFGSARAGTRVVVSIRDVVLTWRDPMRRLPWLIAVLFIFGMPYLYVQGQGTLFAVAVGGILIGTQSGNQFGVDGSGLWLHLVAIGDRAKAKAEIQGHCLTTLVPGLVLTSLGVVAAALVKGDQTWIPAGLGLAWAATMMGIALSALMSAKLPVAIPQSRTAMFASAVPAHKSRSLGMTAVILSGSLGLSLPTGILVLLAVQQDLIWGWAALVFGPISGLLVLTVLINVAATTYFDKGPEILAQVMMGDRV